VDHAAAVRVIDGVAGGDEPPQQLAQLERPAAGVVPEGLVGMEAVDGLLEGVALDEPHGVEGPAVGVGAEAVDRDDAGVLQAAGDLGLGQEAGAAVGVVGAVVEDLLEGHLAVQLLVAGDEEGAQAAAVVEAEDAVSLPVRGGGADGVGGGELGVAVAVGAEGEADERRVDLRVAEGGEAPPDRRPDSDGGQALLGVAAVLLEVLGGQRLDQAALLGVEMAEGLEVVVQGPGLVAGPGVEGGDELGLVDQADLEGQQAEEEVPVGVGGHRVCLRNDGRGLSPRRRVPGAVRPPHRSDYRMIAHATLPRSGRFGLARPIVPSVRAVVGAPFDADRALLNRRSPTSVGFCPFAIARPSCTARQLRPAAAGCTSGNHRARTPDET
jgi:hypothetical protein